MNGIEKIARRIAADAATENSVVREASEQRCAQIRAQYDKQAIAEYNAIIQEGAKANEQHSFHIKRMAALEAQKSTLAMKQQMVSEAFDLAKREIISLPEQEYIEFLARQASEAAVTGEGEIILNTADRSRFGTEITRAANELLSKRGVHGGLTLSENDRPMSGGLIIKQGAIEINCTVDTLLELSRNELASCVAEVLFEN